MPVSIQMIDYGSTMATRQRGEELRTTVLDIADGATHLVLDFQGVLGISSSFADEFVGRLAVGQNEGDDDHKVEVINARREIQRVVDRVLERRRSFVPNERFVLDESEWQVLNSSLTARHG